MPVGYSYIRFSTMEQKKGHSIERQEDAFKRACNRHGLTPASETFYDLGRSGWKKREVKTVEDKLDPVKSLQQRELKRFADLVKAGRIPSGAWIVLDEISRLGRIGNDGIRFLMRFLVENGITVCLETDLVITKENIDDFAVVMRVCILAEMAKMESDRKSKFVGAAWRNKLATASKDNIATARGPLWLIPKMADLPNGRSKVVGWQVDEAKANVIQKIFWLCTVNGMGTRTIAKWLNQNGVTPFTGNGRWWTQTVRRYITDGRVTGRFRSVPDYFPAIVDESTYLKAKAAISQRNRFRGRSERVSNLFTGLAFDGEGNGMVLSVKSPKVKYWTVGKNYTDSSTNGANFPYPIYEREFLRLTKELTLKDIGRKMPEFDSQIDQLEAKKADLELRIENLNKELDRVGASEVPRLAQASIEWERQHKAIAQQLEDLRAKQQASRPDEALMNCQTVLCQLDKVEGDELIELRSQLRQAIRQLVQRIDCRIVKNKAVIDLYSIIHFQSGEKRLLFVRSRLGKWVISVFDHHKWKEQNPGRTVVLHNVDERNTDDVFTEEGLKAAGLAIDSFLNVQIAQEEGGK